jgi:hypothetical protein
LDICTQLRLSLTYIPVDPGVLRSFNLGTIYLRWKLSSVKANRHSELFSQHKHFSRPVNSPQLSFKRTNNESCPDPIHGILPASLRGKVEAT